MVCPKCKHDNVVVNTSTRTEPVKESCLKHFILFILTGGFWIIWLLIRKRKTITITETYATCQTCGNSWKVK